MVSFKALIIININIICFFSFIIFIVYRYFIPTLTNAQIYLLLLLLLVCVYGLIKNKNNVGPLYSIVGISPRRFFWPWCDKKYRFNSSID